MFSFIGWMLVMQARPAYSAHRILKEMARQTAEKTASQDQAGETADRELPGRG